jgi:hypothetical protein
VYTKVLTVAASDDALDSNAATITGGTGTADELQVTATSGTDTILLTNVTAIEKITTVGALGNVTMVLVNGNVAAGKTLTIDGTSFDGDILSVNAAAEASGTVKITVDGTGAHTATLGSGNDTFTSTSTGVDTVVATAGANIISTGAGADIITVGTGVDTITAAAGANEITVAASGQLTANSISITDWTAATYEINLTLAALNVGAVLNEAKTGTDAAASDAVIELITGTMDLADVAADNTIVLYLNPTSGGVVTNIASSSALEDALEYGGSMALYTNGAWAAGDRLLVSYDDGTDTFVAMVTVNALTADNSWFSSGSLAAVNIVRLVGVSDVTDTDVSGEIDLI